MINSIAAWMAGTSWPKPADIVGERASEKYCSGWALRALDNKNKPDPDLWEKGLKTRIRGLLWIAEKIYPHEYNSYLKRISSAPDTRNKTIEPLPESIDIWITVSDKGDLSAMVFDKSLKFVGNYITILDENPLLEGYRTPLKRILEEKSSCVAKIAWKNALVVLSGLPETDPQSRESTVSLPCFATERPDQEDVEWALDEAESLYHLTRETISLDQEFIKRNMANLDKIGENETLTIDSEWPHAKISISGSTKKTIVEVAMEKIMEKRLREDKPFAARWKKIQYRIVFETPAGYDKRPFIQHQKIAERRTGHQSSHKKIYATRVFGRFLEEIMERKEPLIFPRMGGMPSW